MLPLLFVATMAQAHMVAPLGVSMERLGSGTTWIPDAVSLPSRQTQAGSWSLMLHGFLFGHYERQSGPRGEEQLGSLNWAMLMASRNLAGGRFQARTMLSLDPATVSDRGYPLLLQSGESYRGRPLVDRQHPHDFWMELAVMYERALSSSLGVSLYAAPSGEPALGPVAFMHRPSAMDDPVAPLGHHWQDATHISFGVVTAGLFGRRWKLEGSIFNGREPDEERWGFDPIRLNSYAGRFTFNPGARWSFTAGYGFLERPEVLHPGESLHRLSASALYGQPLGTDGQLAAAAVWGANRVAGQATHSALLEMEAILDRTNTVLARAELVEKSAEDLQLPGSVPPDQTFSVAAISLGYTREVARTAGTTIGVGIRGTVNVVPADLRAIYGSRTPAGVFLLLRLRPLREMQGMRMPTTDMKEH
ncbi:MAG TPA: hypothetical protein VFM23_10200 [Gemmatimonadales bacterium]|nr:hypothetical protein [Gemmatimonadales bacterium]